MRRQLALQRIRELSHPLEPQPTGLKPVLRPLAGVRAVLFDVYGTLFISAPDPRRGPDGPLAAAFAALQLPLPAAAAERADGVLEQIIQDRHHRARAEGLGFPEVDIVSVFQELLRRLRATAAVALPHDRGTAERLALENELRRNSTWPMPAARTTLETLKNRGLLLGIVSNSQFHTPWLFPALMGADLAAIGFRAALCAWSYRTGCAKPSPALFLGPLRELQRRGVPAAGVLMVGNDHGNDVLPASRLGCRTALFAGDARSYRPPAPSAQGAQGAQEAAGRGSAADLRLTALGQLPELVR